MRYGQSLVGAVFHLKPPCLCVIEDAWLMYSWREYLISFTLSAVTWLLLLDTIAFLV